MGQFINATKTTRNTTMKLILNREKIRKENIFGTYFPMKKRNDI